MIGPAAGFLLAIMGCGEGDAQCQQVAVAPAAFRTEEACRAASAAEVAQHNDADYPVVVAQCRRAGARVAVNASGVRRPDGQTQAVIRTAAR
jgi:hypothetical protein